MTEIELHREPSQLTAQMDYARAVASGSMLPDNYRNKPADILIAVGLGQAMGLSPAESLYRISVIKGKPTASAELIAAQVRKAGHKLRVKGDDTSCTATIVRADDPDFPFEVTRDIAWARGMGLADNANYKKQPGTMLQWRAITAVARLACPEALYGVQYTPDEVEGWDGTTQPPRSGGLAAAMQVDRAETVEAVDEGEAPATEAITDAQMRKIGALMRELQITERDDALLYVTDTIGREVGSRKELTKDEAGLVIDSLERDREPVQGELVEEPS